MTETKTETESAPDADPHRGPARGGGPRRGGRRDGGGAPSAAGRTAPGGRRHQGRILALQILFEVDVTGHDLAEVLPRTLEEEGGGAAVRAHVERLTRGTLAALAEIDPYLAAAAPAFPVARLPAVDRNVLRLAIYELLHEPEVPPKAAINEAVELAKRFGGDNSGRFVNGVLGTVAARIEREESVPSADVVPPPDETGGHRGSIEETPG